MFYDALVPFAERWNIITAKYREIPQGFMTVGEVAKKWVLPSVPYITTIKKDFFPHRQKAKVDAGFSLLGELKQKKIHVLDIKVDHGTLEQHFIEMARREAE